MLEGVIGLLAGVIVGVSIAAIVMKNRDGSDESVVSIKRENEAFRDEVNEHFVQTAELINQLTDSYKAVFDHLSDGAEKLVAPEVSRERMPQVSGEEVRLKRIGSTSSTNPEEDSKTSDQEPESAGNEAPEAQTQTGEEASETVGEATSADQSESSNAGHGDSDSDREDNAESEGRRHGSS